VDPWRETSPRWSRFAGRTGDPVGDPRWNSLFLKDCTPWEGLMLEQLMKKCLLWEGPHPGGGRKLGVKLSTGRR